MFKKICFIILTVFVISNTKAQHVSLYTLELESYTMWTAVDGKWKDVREQWVTLCKNENTAEQSGKLLLAFESYIVWAAVENNWKVRRNGWIAEVKAAATFQQLAKLLMELEANIKWASVDPRWKDRREGWLADLKSGETKTNEVLKSISAATKNN
jgi:hypothetical protein